MPLRTTLENFINHVETLESKKSEGDDMYEKEFKLLKTLTESLRNSPQYSSSHGENEVNRKKNRYKDIVPYDYTRVTVSSIPGVPTSDYVNASYIKGASGSMAYIASQGPLPSTTDDFWRLIWECEIQVIIMSCNEIESGKRKCDKYWVDRGEEKTFGNIKVKFIRIKQVCAEFVVRTMLAISGKQERTIVQFHYISWPDHGIPDSVKPILKMVKLVRGCQASETLPVLVHCSAGCGRTGTICAIDFVWGLLRTGKLNDDFSLFQLVSNMRKQRIAMVQTKEQYILVYRAVKELFEEHLQVMDSHPYENVDFSGTPITLLESECSFIDDEDDSKSSIKSNEILSINEDSEEKETITADIENSTEEVRTGSVQHLISSWNSGYSDKQLSITETETSDSKTTSPSEHHYENISLYSTSTASLATSPTESDLQPEKAVIVHKPSIARLRAIFEKNNVDDNSKQEITDENTVVQPRRVKSRKKNMSEKRRSSKKEDNGAGLRYRDTALTVYSELRHSQDGIEIRINEEIQPQTPPLVPETPDFIRRDKSNRNSLRRSSSSVWYDEETHLKEAGETEKPALPVKRSKSLKMFKQPSKVSPDSLEVPVNGHGKDSNQEESATLPKGVIKLKSSPWNPRRSQSMNSSKHREEKDRVKTKPWYLFSDKEPDAVAGFDKAGIQLVQVKINADDKQLVFSEDSGSCANTDKQVSNMATAPVVEENNSFIIKAKEIEFTIHEPAVEKKIRVPKVEKIKYEPQRALMQMQTSCNYETEDDKPPPLPVKMYSPSNSPRLHHQDVVVRNLRLDNEKKELDSKTNITKDDNEVENKPITDSDKIKISGGDVINLSSSDSVVEKSEITVKDTKLKSDDESESESEVEAEESSYQQIIKDCQEYLISSGYNSNVFPKMYQNLAAIQTTLERNPRGGFVDLLSIDDDKITDTSNSNEELKPVANCDTIKNLLSQSNVESSPVPEEFYMAEDVQEILREIEADGVENEERKCDESNAPKKHYEHLWLSRSGKLNSDESADSIKQDDDTDLRSYKIVQQVLNSCKEREECVDVNVSQLPHHVFTTESDNKKNVKSKKPKPLPRKIIPPPSKLNHVETCDIAGTVDFSSEDDDDDGAGGDKSDSGNVDEQHGCIYSEVLKEKPKITYQFRLHHGSKDDLYLYPSAPPRLKRQFSLQQPKISSVEVDNSYKWRHTLPGRLPANMKKVKLKSERKWGEEWQSDDDCTPPVPEKTREAYMLPNETSEILKKSISTEDKSSATGTKSFAKFGILSKLGLKMENKVADDVHKTRQQSNSSNEHLTEYAYPNRLAQKPKGPRSPPPEWTSNKSKVPS